MFVMLILAGTEQLRFDRPGDIFSEDLDTPLYNSIMKPRLLDKFRFRQTPFEGKAAAIYVRVSQRSMILGLNGMEERTSVPAQRAQAMAYCQSKGWSSILYDGDNDESGSTDYTNRGDLDRMLGDVRAGKIHTLICVDPSRLSRNAHLLSEIIYENLLPAGVDIFCLQKTGVTLATTDGRMLLSIDGQLNERALLEQAEKSMRSKAILVADGKMRVKKPFGYDIVETDGVRRCVVKESQAKIVRELFQRCAAGHGLNKLAKWMISIGAKTAKGTSYTEPNIRKLLTRRIYKGQCQYGGKVYDKSPYPAIIEPDLFDKVQASLASRGCRRGVRTGAHLLMGVLKCGSCLEARRRGEPRQWISYAHTVKWSSENGKRWAWRSYRCQMGSKRGADICRSPCIKADIIETFVIDMIKSMAKMDFITTISKRGAKENYQADLADLEADALKAKDRMNQAAFMFAEGKIEAGQLTTITEKYRKILKALGADMEDFRAKISASGVREAAGAMQQASIWQSLPEGERRLLVLRVLDRIIVYPDRLIVHTRCGCDWPVTVPLKRSTRNVLIPAIDSVDKVVLDALLPKNGPIDPDAFEQPNWYEAGEPYPDDPSSEWGKKGK